MLSDDKVELYAIRDVLDANQTVCDGLNAIERHILADQLAEAVVCAIDRAGQATRRLVFDSEANPHCSWCGGMGCNDGTEPLMSSLHPQYGFMCTCTGPRNVRIAPTSPAVAQ
jgi:hypothetical protein